MSGFVTAFPRVMRLSSRLMAAAIASVFLLSACGTSSLLPGGAGNKPVEASGSTAVAPSATAAPTPRRIKIGLALGGGAARGFAHIGVIKALEAQGITVDVVAGTSAGSLVGALYAAGNDGFALQKLALAMDEAAISDWSVPLFSKVSGVLKGEGVQNYVNKAVHNVPIEKFKIPFGAVATDLRTGQPILFQRGNAGVAVRASSAVPGVFQSVRIGDHTYVDGGLVSPVPVRFARQMGADFVIAVNISANPEAQAASSSSIDVLLQTFAIMGQTINQYELKNADIVLQPGLGSMKGSDFASRNVAILAGEQAATAAMPEIKRKLKLMATGGN
jgi:NTE family protein